MSAYAALAGMQASVFMPRDVPSVFVAASRALGAGATLVVCPLIFVNAWALCYTIRAIHQRGGTR
jgi:threonine dehydratase